MTEQLDERKNIKVDRGAADALDQWCTDHGWKQYAVVERMVRWFLIQRDPETLLVKMKRDVDDAERAGQLSTVDPQHAAGLDYSETHKALRGIAGQTRSARKAAKEKK